jgi:hypothetical protein
LQLFIKQRAFDNKNPITPEIMARIAEEEAEAAAAQNKRTLSSQTTESEIPEIPADDDDDYDNLVS